MLAGHGASPAGGACVGCAAPVEGATGAAVIVAGTPPPPPQRTDHEPENVSVHAWPAHV